MLTAWQYVYRSHLIHTSLEAHCLEAKCLPAYQSALLTHYPRPAVPEANQSQSPHTLPSPPQSKTTPQPSSTSRARFPAAQRSASAATSPSSASTPPRASQALACLSAMRRTSSSRISPSAKSQPAMPAATPSACSPRPTSGWTTWT